MEVSAYIILYLNLWELGKTTETENANKERGQRTQSLESKNLELEKNKTQKKREKEKELIRMEEDLESVIAQKLRVKKTTLDGMLKKDHPGLNATEIWRNRTKN